MNPSFNDPNNHVPEVKPGDDWGDDTGTPEIPGLALPPKKPARKSAAKRRNAGLEDPRNHVPQVAPGDSWDAAESAGVLPKKRQPDEKPAGFHAPVPDEDRGVEIGVRTIERSDPADPKSGVQRLEVQEHVPKLLAPDAPPPPPKIVPKNVIERSETEPAPVAGERSFRSAESDAWGTAKTMPVRWMVISIASIGVFVLAGVLLLPHFGWKRERSTRLNYSKLQVYDEGPKAAPTDDLNLTEGIEEKAKKLVEGFVGATKVEDVLPLVRDRERVEPILRQRWKPMAAGQGWTVPDNSEWSIRKSDKREYGYLSGMLPDITPFRFYIVQQGDAALLDWEASTGFSETPFEDLVQGKGAGGVTRCLLSPGDLYTFSVPEAEYHCFRLGSPDGENAAWGYVRRDSPVAEKLTGLFVQGAIPREIYSEYPLTVTLGKAPGESLPNQWLITEMLHMEWISP